MDDPATSWPAAEARRFAELIALCGIAITQPVLDVFGNSPADFVARDAATSVLVLFALGVALLPPAALLLVGQVGRAAGEVGRTWAHQATLGALGGVVVMRVVETAGGAPMVTSACGVAGAVALAVALHRWESVRTWSLLLAPTSAAFVVLFLVGSPTGELLRLPSPDVEPAPDDGEHPDVVLIVFDELPLATLLDEDGQIDRAAYPALAGLADDATWYRNTTTTSAWTRLAVPSVLTGQVPRSADLLPVAAVQPQSLFTALGGPYDLNVVEPFTRLCPTSLCPRSGPSSLAATAELLDEAVDVWWRIASPSRVPGVTFDLAVAAGEGPPQHALASLAEGIGRSDRPVLHVVHVQLPHQPWVLDADAVPYAGSHPPPGLDVDTRWTDAAAAADARRRHVLQAAGADRLLGDLLDVLHRTDAYDDAVVVVTADHGVSFEVGHDLRGAGDATATTAVWVPLLVKAPGQTTGAVRDVPASTVDVVPTIASLADVALRWSVDGVDLTGAVPADRERWFLPTFKDEWAHGTLHLLPSTAPAALLDASAAPALGDDAGWAPYQHGPYASMVGTLAPTERSTTVAGTGGGVIAVDPDAGVLPLQVTGSVAADATGDWVLIVVDGVVAGTGELHPAADGERRFDVVTASQSWPTSGAATVEVLVATGAAADPQLSAVA